MYETHQSFVVTEDRAFHAPDEDPSSPRPFSRRVAASRRARGRCRPQSDLDRRPPRRIMLAPPSHPSGPVRRGYSPPGSMEWPVHDSRPTDDRRLLAARLAGHQRTAEPGPLALGLSTEHGPARPAERADDRDAAAVRPREGLSPGRQRHPGDPRAAVARRTPTPMSSTRSPRYRGSRDAGSTPGARPRPSIATSTRSPTPMTCCSTQRSPSRSRPTRATARRWSCTTAGSNG